MFNTFCKTPLWEQTRLLADTAMGRSPADLVIRDAKLVNVCTGEIQEHTDVAVTAGRIALVGDAAHCIGANTVVLEARGQYLTPGFLDGHIHVESSMLSVGEYARAVIPHGTTGIYMDPHEIGNVLGVKGIQLMLEDAKRTPLKVMTTAPSCVPAVPGFEDTGASIGPDEIKEMMSWPEIVGLGEMMNFPGVLASDERVHEELANTLKADKIVTGHYSVPETEKGLNAYVTSSARCCHESTRAEDALAKMRLGMYAMLREGSAWHDLHEVAKAVTAREIDSRFAVLVSDDTHPHTLLNSGHMDHILRRAAEEGIEPVKAIQMATINCAQCFRMDHELGSVTPGKCADIVLLESLEDMKVTAVFIDGKLVARNGKLVDELEAFSYPAWARSTMRIGEEISEKSFAIQAPAGALQVRARLIEIIPQRVGNLERIVDLPVQNGKIEADITRDILKAVVLERHHATGKKGVGLVTGFGIKRGAMAQTVAHDAHNLLVVGTNDKDMVLAAKTLIESGGGLCAVCDGKVLGHVPLPIAGLMNDKSAAEMSLLVGELEAAWREIGCEISSPFMTMALIPLACLPELRLTNRGLVDCRSFAFADLILEILETK